MKKDTEQKSDFDMVEALIGKVPDHIRRLL